MSQNNEENLNQEEVRKLPKGTMIIIVIMTISILGAYLFLTLLKQDKISEVLETLGHKNLSNIKVINKLSVEDKKTRYKTKVYKVKFFDKDLNKTCIGFVHFGRNKQYNKDIDCK